MTWDLALATSFQEANARLAPARQAAVQDTLLKLQKGHASVHVHALESLKYVGIAVTKDAMRIVADREGDTLLLLHVDSHDEAYAWAKRHRTVRVGSVVRVIRTEEAVERAPDGPSGVPGPLQAVPDKVFRRFDVDATAARAFRGVPDDHALLALAALLDPALGEALLGLSADPDDEPALLLAFEAAKTSTKAPVSLAEAIRDPINAAGIWVAPPGEEALAAALRGDLSSWRVFLHPSQQRLARARTSGAVKVTGGPGTGKTVVALHRARWLAEERFADDPRPVLLTAFSRSLVDALRPAIAGLCVDRPDLAARIEARTTLDIAREVLKRAGRPRAFLEGEIVAECWSEALKHETLGFTPPFYRGEREHVVVRHAAWTEAAYLQAARRDRGHALDRSKRKAVWAVLAAFEAALAQRGGGDAAALAREATKALAEGASGPWSAVVCDEMQDTGAAELRLLAALTSEAGVARPDALFLCGDGHQRIFRTPVALLSCGIDVRGRAKRLRLNYRTTEGIRRAAVALVEGQPLDALDEGEALDGYRSLRAGPAPVQQIFPSEEEEAAWIAGEAAGGVLVLARTKAWLEQLRKRLGDGGVPVRMLGEDEDLGAISGAVLCTLHRCKGLEAPRVILAGMQLVPGKWPGEAEAGDREGWERRERALLYVGTTRARDWCGWSRVSAVGQG